MSYDVLLTWIFSLWTKRRSWRRWFAKSRRSWRMPDEPLEPLTRREAIVLVSNSPRCELYVMNNDWLIKKLSRLCWPKTNAAKSKDSAFGNLTAKKLRVTFPCFYIAVKGKKKNLNVKVIFCKEFKIKVSEQPPAKHFLHKRTYLSSQLPQKFTN